MFTLITGATGGLGKAFVRMCAERGDNLILTGRSLDKLIALKMEIEKDFSTLDVRVYAADLSSGKSRDDAFWAMEKDGLKISRLINVAGADIQKAFCDYTQEKVAFQCRANFEGAAAFCLFAVKNRADKLEIINVSSVSGIYPMPYFAIYSALKGALTSFSISLREEMKGKGVFVTAVLPGAMPTRDDIKEQIKGQGLWGKLAVKSPQFVAKKSLLAVRKNRRKIIPGFWNKVMNFGTKCIPLSLKLKFIASRWSKISKDAF